jgi:orotidine-5'-phosphate decarboxylase
VTPDVGPHPRAAGPVRALAATPIVALDVPTARDALGIVERLGDLCRFYKVGSELFTAAGPAIVDRLRAAGCDVFLDLKFHDIPNTVRAGVRSAATLGARLVTVHASGGAAMLSAAVEGAAAGEGDGCGVLAVTVLTSLDAAALARAWGRTDVDVPAEVLRLAGEARRAGTRGIVCSGAEAPVVRAAHGAALQLLVPGVRLAGEPSHDQARVVTPETAVAAGATYVVLGRTVTAAADPPGAMRAALAALSERGRVPER